jgi:phage/plasmid-associated DNA primase
VKYAPSRTIQWRVPGILAGNEVPGWVDNAGSINRRIVLFEFDKRVTNGDMMLGQKLAGEMAHIIARANRAYLDAVKKYAKDNVWNHLPSAFHKAKEDLTEAVNSMVSYLKSGKIVFDAELYMPFMDFMEGYKDYCRQTGMRAVNQTEFKSHLRAMSCDIMSKTTLKYPPGGAGVFMANCKFIMGADVQR